MILPIAQFSKPAVCCLGSDSSMCTSEVNPETHMQFNEIILFTSLVFMISPTLSGYLGLLFPVLEPKSWHLGIPDWKISRKKRKKESWDLTFPPLHHELPTTVSAFRAKLWEAEKERGREKKKVNGNSLHITGLPGDRTRRKRNSKDSSHFLYLREPFPAPGTRVRGTLFRFCFHSQCLCTSGSGGCLCVPTRQYPRKKVPVLTSSFAVSFPSLPAPFISSLQTAGCVLSGTCLLSEQRQVGYACAIHHSTQYFYVSNCWKACWHANVLDPKCWRKPFPYPVCPWELPGNVIFIEPQNLLAFNWRDYKVSC